MLGWLALSVASRSWYIAAGPFALVSLLIVAFNLHCAVLGLRGMKAPSMVPLLGGLMGLIVVQVGHASGQWSAWPALVLVLVDPLLLFLPWLLWGLFAKRSERNPTASTRGARHGSQTMGFPLGVLDLGADGSTGGTDDSEDIRFRIPRGQHQRGETRSDGGSDTEG